MDAERKVDVLAVMDTDGRAIAALIDSCSPGSLRQKQWDAHLVRHDEARAAVAELIEAVKENRIVTQDFANDGCPDNYFKYEASDRRVMAALSRLGASA